MWTGFNIVCKPVIFVINEVLVPRCRCEFFDAPSMLPLI